MKALRFLFLSLLAAFSFAASAQTIEVYKDGRVIDSFTAAQVDSVVYTPTAAQPRYYYYAGWDCPTSVEGTEETSLVNLINKTYPRSKSDNTQNKAGGEIVGEIANFEYSFLAPNNIYNSESLINYYVVVPQQLKIYDSLNNDLTTASSAIFTKIEKEIEGYKVYESKSASRNINAIIIKK